jgi:hypothetical protein
MKIGVDWHIISEALWCSQQSFEFDLFDGPFLRFAGPSLMNCIENFIITEWSKFFQNFGLLFQQCQIRSALNNLKIVPQLSNNISHGSSSVGQGQYTYNLREIGI